MNIRSPRFTPAMAVAILALVVALSSSATAALLITGGQIKNGTITGKDIKRKTIAKKHIKKNAITSKQVKNRSLTGVDIRDHTLTGTDIANNSITTENLRDGTITNSDLSTTLIQQLGGPDGFEVVTTASESGALIARRAVSASCPAGKVAVSANAFSDGPLDIAPPEVRRNTVTTFTARDSAPVAVIGNGKIQLQVTCLSAG